MSTLDAGHWAGVLMARYADRNVVGSALHTFTPGRPPFADEPVVVKTPLTGHPADFLIRHRPPHDCLALGLVCAGWAAPIDTTVRPSAHPDAKRILQVVVVSTGGEVGSRIRMPDGEIIDLGAPGYGRVLDALHAALRRRRRPPKAA